MANQLAAQRVQRRSVGVFARGRPCGHPASDAVHDALPVQSLAADQGDRERAGRLSKDTLPTEGIVASPNGLGFQP